MGFLWYMFVISLNNHNQLHTTIRTSTTTTSTTTTTTSTTTTTTQHPQQQQQHPQQQKHPQQQQHPHNNHHSDTATTHHSTRTICVTTRARSRRSLIASDNWGPRRWSGDGRFVGGGGGFEGERGVLGG